MSEAGSNHVCHARIMHLAYFRKTDFNSSEFEGIKLVEFDQFGLTHVRDDKMDKVTVLGAAIAYYHKNEQDYISLTDMVKNFGDDTMIYSWMRNRNTLEFIGIWEELQNPSFNGNGFVTFKSQAGLNSFNLTPRKWIDATQAIGFLSKSGRYGGGTFAHRDIAFEFASWLSPQFKLYLIMEFQRLKAEELTQLGWDIRRNLAKINYRIHADAIKENLVPPELNVRQTNLVYATDADVLNMALFGMTAKDWREKNPGSKGNIRDYADVSQLVCLSNLENLNALFIRENVPQSERLRKLNQIAIHQMKLLTDNPSIKQLAAKDK